MSFHFRKSWSSGPFRITASKSGLSYSFGIKGARISASRRGTYVTVGSNGIYYRKKISQPINYSHEAKEDTTLPPVQNHQHTITSGNVELITDTDSQDFINELAEKSKKIAYYNWLGIFPLTVIVVVLCIFFFIKPNLRTVYVTTNADYVTTSSVSNLNIRQSPEKKGKVVGLLHLGEEYKLLDSTNHDWYKIDFGYGEGFVLKRLSTKIQRVTTLETNDQNTGKSLFEKAPRLFWQCLIIIAVVFSFWLRFLKGIDKRRFLVEIYYDIDENVNCVYQKFILHFSELLDCSRVWQYLHSQRTNDYKYSSGAAHTVARKPLAKIFKNKTPCRVLKTNVQIPCLGLINTELYFFPERIVIKRGNQYGAIMYKNLDCAIFKTHFIESEGVPKDAVVVGRTWRYLNKNGTPDKRFNNNYQLPICEYSEYTFESVSGLNEKIATSKVGGFDNFVRYLKAIGQLQRTIA